MDILTLDSNGLRPNSGSDNTYTVDLIAHYIITIFLCHHTKMLHIIVSPESRYNDCRIFFMSLEWKDLAWQQIKSPLLEERKLFLLCHLLLFWPSNQSSTAISFIGYENRWLNHGNRDNCLHLVLDPLCLFSMLMLFMDYLIECSLESQPAFIQQQDTFQVQKVQKIKTSLGFNRIPFYTYDPSNEIENKTLYGTYFTPIRTLWLQS